MRNSVYSHYATSNTTSAKEPVLSWAQRSCAAELAQPLSHLNSAQLLPAGSTHRAPNTDPNPLCQSTLSISAGAKREGKNSIQTERFTKCSLGNSFQYYFIYTEICYFNIFQYIYNISV